jgi:hypothetical protein
MLGAGELPMLLNILVLVLIIAEARLEEHYPCILYVGKWKRAAHSSFGL